jgi:hypothetical protein
MRPFQSVPILVLGLAIGLASASSSDDPALQVVVSTSVALNTLLPAEAETGWVFEQTRIRLIWENCGPADLCPVAQDPPHVSLVIGSGLRRRDALGCTRVNGAEGAAAFIGIDTVQRFAAASRIPVPIILAAVMAHEMGHLLLGPAHARSGLMHGYWDQDDLAHLSQRRLKFDLDQCTRLKAVVLARSVAGHLLLAAR